MNEFKNGYALLIAVDDNSVIEWVLPNVVKDIDALGDVLLDSERCGYSKRNVRIINGPDATREGIINGLEWLGDCVRKDQSDNETAIVYYTGHGWKDENVAPPAYYLIPYDVNTENIETSALRVEDFAARIEQVKPRRLFVVFDCCHSGGMKVKSLGDPSAGYSRAAMPTQILMKGKIATTADGAKGLEELGRGSGRAVLSSSKGDQRSYMRKDGSMSIFTYHLIEAFTGYAQPVQGATEVLVSDVMSHVWRKVPESAQKDYNVAQNPDYQVSGNFPVALLLGGQGWDKILAIRAFEDKVDQGDYVDRQMITHNVNLLGLDVLEDILEKLVAQYGVDKLMLQELGARIIPEHVDRQIVELVAAQRDIEARGVATTLKVVYDLGMLAAYRRDYKEALRYFRQATQIDAAHFNSFKAIAWLLQSLAMHDIQGRRYDAAVSKLADAHQAIKQTDPLDPQALVLRGYIAKTFAQITKAKHDARALWEKYNKEALRFFEQVTHLAPTDASAQNGLGNIQHALGNLDAAINAYNRAILINPSYAAAHHDLALAYEDKMKADPVHVKKWCQLALNAWQKAYALAPDDPLFSADYHTRVILPRIKRLERLCS